MSIPNPLRNIEQPLPAEIGYDLAAEWFDQWHWTEFWKKNEAPLVRALISQINPKNALDAGSGTGAYRFQLEESADSVVAIDISREMLTVQARKATFYRNRANAQLLHGDIREMPREWSGKFDCVVCARVLSNIEETDLAIKELSRVVRPQGHLIITDIDPRHHYSNVKIANGVVHSRIVAFKHSREKTEGIFSEYHLKVERKKTFRLRDLVWQPPQDQFVKIYRFPENPIFSLYDLVRAR